MFGVGVLDVGPGLVGVRKSYSEVLPILSWGYKYSMGPQTLF